jgi:hypothetical protein
VAIAPSRRSSIDGAPRSSHSAGRAQLWPIALAVAVAPISKTDAATRRHSPTRHEQQARRASRRMHAATRAGHTTVHTAWVLSFVRVALSLERERRVCSTLVAETSSPRIIGQGRLDGGGGGALRFIALCSSCVCRVIVHRVRHVRGERFFRRRAYGLSFAPGFIYGLCVARFLTAPTDLKGRAP